MHTLYPITLFLILANTPTQLAGAVAGHARGEEVAGYAADVASQLRAQSSPVGTYSLDDRPRKIAKADAECPDVEVIESMGKVIPYQRAFEATPSFHVKMRAFARMAREEGRAILGEELTGIIHRGGYRCRPVTGRTSKWSEHAFGNAIDIAGFRFGEGKGAVRVDVGEHWRATGAHAAYAQFLHAVVRRAIDERYFRIVLGPGDPGHEELLHLDWGTSWYVRVVFSEEASTDTAR